MKKSAFINIFLLSLILLYSGCNPLVKLKNKTEVVKWQQEVNALKSLPVSKNEATLLFLGSSSIRLWDSIQQDMHPYFAINRGYGGAGLMDFVVYANELSAPHKAAAILLFVANDITGSSEDLAPEKVLFYFKLAVKEIRESHPAAPIVWIEVTPTPSRWSVLPEISRSSNLIRTYCEQHTDLYFIATSSHFLAKDGKPDPCLFLPDMLHLNRKGYKLWSEVIKQELSAQLPELSLKH